MIAGSRGFGKETPFDVIIVILVGIFTLLCLYPVIYVISTSMSETGLLQLKGNVNLLPRGFSLTAYRLIFQDPKIPLYYLNSIVYAIGSTVFMIVVTSLAGYALSVRTFFARRFITVLMTITLFVGGGLIPYYLLCRSLGLIDNRLVMIIPAGINVWNVIIFRTFFLQNPVELRESAYLDGANDIVILFRIILPVSLPLLATFSIFGIVGSWNDFFTAMIFINTDTKNPIQILLRRLLILQQMQEEMRRFIQLQAAETPQDIRTVKAAIIVVTILPILCVYPFFQKYFAKGILIGSLKG